MLTDELDQTIKILSVQNEQIDKQIAQIKTLVAAHSLELDMINVSLHYLNNIDLSFKESMNGTETFASSCMEYFHLGDNKNGIYKIRPSLKTHAFEVFCKFTEKEGITIISPLNWRRDGYQYPAKENEQCLEPYCFVHDFNYGISFDQIEVYLIRVL